MPLAIVDPFDSLLISVASILRKTDATPNDDGHQVQTLTPLATGIKCYVSTRVPGKQLNGELNTGVQLRTIFMRPYTGAGAPLKIHDWIQVGSHTYDVLDPVDPGLLGHHLEVLVKEIVP